MPGNQDNLLIVNNDYLNWRMDEIFTVITIILMTNGFHEVILPHASTYGREWITGRARLVDKVHKLMIGNSDKQMTNATKNDSSHALRHFYPVHHSLFPGTLYFHMSDVLRWTTKSLRKIHSLATTSSFRVWRNTMSEVMSWVLSIYWN